MVPPVKHTGVRGNRLQAHDGHACRVCGQVGLEILGQHLLDLEAQRCLANSCGAKYQDQRVGCGVVNRGDQLFFGGNQGRMCDRVSLEIRQALGQGRVSSSRGKPAPPIALELPICLDDVMLLHRSHLECAFSGGWTASCMDRIKNSRTRSNSGTLTVGDPLLQQEFLRFDRCQEIREAPSSDSVLSRMILVKAPDLFGCQHEFAF